MKIFIIGTASPYRGSGSVFNERMAREFMSEGHEVEILTYKLQYPTLFFSKKRKMSGNPAPQDIFIERQINTINPFNWAQVVRYIKKSMPDKVIFSYANSYFAFCFGSIANGIGKNSKIQRIALLKEIIPSESSIVDKTLPFHFVRNVDGFVTISKDVIEDIEYFDKKNKPKKYSYCPINDHYGEKINREEALSALRLNPDYRYILFFGYIKAYKGIDLLIDAFADDRIRKYNVKLILAGEFKDNIQPYIDKIRNARLNDYLELRTEYITNDDVNKYFSSSDLIVQPYKTPKESGVTQVAYHFGKPMLVTNVGKLADVVPNGVVGYVVEPDAKQIADAIVDFYENNRREEFEKNVAIEKQKFTWSNLTKTIETLFD